MPGPALAGRLGRLSPELRFPWLLRILGRLRDGLRRYLLDLLAVKGLFSVDSIELPTDAVSAIAGSIHQVSVEWRWL